MRECRQGGAALEPDQRVPELPRMRSNKECLKRLSKNDSADAAHPLFRPTQAQCAYWAAPDLGPEAVLQKVRGTF
ncbi:hypothetical protein So717_32060 [Roseobacter cerasinus]|uniref:Uncharacterized protein n=1 Tax=Roseobacter cerasinus TaxID=2602289 RepID=A0A640VTB3_9RHOB|nr:hypothetical protein So717_32060 [Roseobacter cerasinus]